MTYRGRVKNGTIVLDDPAALPEGIEVDVSPVDNGGCGKKEQEPKLSQYDRLKDVIGIVSGPPDLARNLDHYRLGTPKK